MSGKTRRNAALIIVENVCFTKKYLFHGEPPRKQWCTEKYYTIRCNQKVVLLRLSVTS